MRVMTYPPALPIWEGGLMPDEVVGFPRQCSFSRSISLSPFGETGEGFGVSECRGMGVVPCGGLYRRKKGYITRFPR